MFIGNPHKVVSQKGCKKTSYSSITSWQHHQLYNTPFVASPVSVALKKRRIVKQKGSTDNVAHQYEDTNSDDSLLLYKQPEEQVEIAELEP